MKSSFQAISGIFCLSLFACGAPAPDTANATNLAPTAPAQPGPPRGTTPTATTAARDKTDGTTLTIRLGNDRSVALQGFKVDARRGLSNAQCGVTIDRQRLVTMGAGDSEAYTCGTLAAAGALPPVGTIQRIGLIYDVASPNAQFRTAIVLRDAGGTWEVDPAFTGRFDDTPAGRSLPTLRKAIR